MRRWMSVTILGAVLAALLPAAAGARPAGSVPDARALRGAGLAVRWPLAGPVVSGRPGTRLAVTVRRLRRGAPVATVALIQVAASGRGLQVVAARRVRSGRVALTVPRGTGAHYALRLRAGRLSYAGWIDPPPTVPAPPIAPPAPVPTPSPGPPTPPLCPAPSGTPAATLTLAAPSFPVGGTLDYTLTDSGPTCITTGSAFGWQRLDGDTWTDVPSTMAFTAIAYILRPGAARTGTAMPEPSMAPGHYRLVVGWLPDPLTAPATSGPVATAEVDMVPAAAG